MTDVQQIKQNAKNLYKEKRYVEALKLYRYLWSKYQKECDEWDTRYYAWSIYRLEVRKPNEDIAKAEGILFRAANAILTLLTPKDLCYKPTVLKVLDYLTSKKIFPAKDIIKWTDKIDPSDLSLECYSFQDKSGEKKELPSEREKWYALRTKALEKIGCYNECLQLSEQALVAIDKFHYNNDIWFKRRIALSQWQLGQPQKAIDLLKSILNQRKEWFIQHEIANFYFELGQPDEALKYAVDSALNFGELKFKWQLFLLMGKIFKTQSKMDIAQKHILLAFKLREESGWKKVPQDLLEIIKEFNIDTTTSISIDDIYSELKKIWQSIRQSRLPQCNGVIKTILLNNLAGFISGNNGKDYYFKIKNFLGRKDRVKLGLPVTFYIEKSFDKKKGRESEIAVDIKELQ